ncbi:cell division ATPase MinD [Haloferax sp. DFSO60]|uniref:cell division ATPase MinD n=1 Tax=Haloferax sp. DFSO60 TaxID=3388652 RepID=UPI00397D22F9
MARVYAVASAKGGVGKTTTTANLGTVLAMAGHDVLVVDGDLGMPNLASALGVEPDRTTLHDVLTGDSPVSEAIYEGPAGLDVLPGSPALEAFAKAESTGLESIIPSLESQYDIIIVDTGAGLSNDTFVPMKLADEVLLVSTTERSSLGDTEKTRQLAKRIGAETVGVVLTRVDQTNPNADEVASRLDAGVIAVVPEDSAIREALNSQAPAVLRSPDSIASAGYRALAEALIGQPVPAPQSDESMDDESVAEAETVETASDPEPTPEQTVVEMDHDTNDGDAEADADDDAEDSLSESVEEPDAVAESDPVPAAEPDPEVVEEPESVPDSEPTTEAETPSLSFDSNPESHGEDEEDEFSEADAIPFSSGSVSEPAADGDDTDEPVEEPATAAATADVEADADELAQESEPAHDPLAEAAPAPSEDEPDPLAADPLESTDDIGPLADADDVASVTGGPSPDSTPTESMADDPLAADAEPMGEPLHEETTTESAPDPTPETTPEPDHQAAENDPNEPVKSESETVAHDSASQESESQTPEPAVTDENDEPLVAEAEPTTSEAEVIEHEDEETEDEDEDGVYTTSLVEEIESLDDDEPKEKKKGFFSRFLG